jgi:multidrug efflux pump subunit AcrA (membrane-fusion protein)
LIPQDIIIEEENTQKVFVVENSRAIEKPVTIGIVNHPLVEVIDGLKEGDIVITQGFYALKDGIKVRVKELLDQGS